MPTVAIRGVFLFVKTMGLGRGSPIVLMHGGPGLDHTTLLGLSPLGRDHTLVFYDHRGNGRSSGNAETMTWDNLTADADALRGTFGCDQWIVLGQSFGGQVALEYALRYPRARVASHPDGYGGRRAVERGTRATSFGQARVSALKDWSVMDRLREVHVPTLVVAGRDDFLFPPEAQAILADRLPNATLEIIELAGHNPQEENPKAVIDVIRGFLARERTLSIPRDAAPATAGG